MYQSNKQQLGVYKVSFRNQHITKTARERFHIDCTGNVCVGDIVMFTRAIFTGSYRKATFSHYEEVIAMVLKDSYGKDKQQHTFTLELIALDGKKVTGKLLIKGRNLYRNGTKRMMWADELSRHKVLSEKYIRGDHARQVRTMRIKKGE